jgi:hypothetical protein
MPRRLAALTSWAMPLVFGLSLAKTSVTSAQFAWRTANGFYEGANFTQTRGAAQV